MARAAEPCEITTSVVVNCSIQPCWDIYINNSLLKEWAPAVSAVDCDANLIALNGVRKCSVTIDKNSGYTIEKCSGFVALKRIDFITTEESFGFSHMLTEYGFSVTFDVDGEQTLLVMTTRYTPKKIFASVMRSKPTQQQLLRVMHETTQGFRDYAENSTVNNRI